MYIDIYKFISNDRAKREIFLLYLFCESFFIYYFFLDYYNIIITTNTKLFYNYFYLYSSYLMIFIQPSFHYFLLYNTIKTIR